MIKGSLKDFWALETIFMATASFCFLLEWRLLEYELGVKHWGYLQVHVKIWFPKLRNIVNLELNQNSALKVSYKEAQCIKGVPNGFALTSGLTEENIEKLPSSYIKELNMSAEYVLSPMVIISDNIIKSYVWTLPSGPVVNHPYTTSHLFLNFNKSS